MAIDLTNPEAKKGAEDALTILIKSKYGPIVLTQSGNGGDTDDGPKLTPPKNTEIRDQNGNPVLQDSNDDKNDKDNKNGGGGQKEADTKDNQGDGDSSQQNDVKVIKTGEERGSTSNSGSNGQNKATANSANGKNSDLYDKEKNAKTLQDVKDDLAYKREKAEQARKEADRKEKAATKAADFSELENDLYYTIQTQIEQNAGIESTWSKGNKSWADAAGVLAAKDARTEPRKTKPLLYVFFDQSVSFNSDDIKRGQAVVKCLDDFVERGLIAPSQYFYFADHCYTTPEPARKDRGTNGWDECMDRIRNSLSLPLDKRCTNVLVISDDDIERQTQWSLVDPIKLEGSIFWCWKKDSRSPTAEKYLTGEEGSTRYKF